MKLFGQPASASTITHLKRELFQQVWDLLLDPEFLYAYEHGIVLKCADGITRQIFPRFFYLFCWLPWKVSPLWSTLYQFANMLYRIILATIQYLGGCPCPRCFIRKDQISALGTKVDDQRRSHLCTDTEQRQHKVNQTQTWIFNNGRGINSTWVENLLQADSWIPTRVCAFIISQLFFYLSILNRMPFHPSYFNSDSIFFPW